MLSTPPKKKSFGLLFVQKVGIGVNEQNKNCWGSLYRGARFQAKPAISIDLPEVLSADIFYGVTIRGQPIVFLRFDSKCPVDSGRSN